MPALSNIKKTVAAIIAVFFTNFDSKKFIPFVLDFPFEDIEVVGYIKYKTTHVISITVPTFKTAKLTVKPPLIFRHQTCL